jgi:hypothetical protein
MVRLGSPRYGRARPWSHLFPQALEAMKMKMKKKTKSSTYTTFPRT